MSPTYKPPSVETIPEPPEDLAALVPDSEVPSSKEQEDMTKKRAPDIIVEHGTGDDRGMENRHQHRHQKATVLHHGAAQPRPRSVGSRRISTPAVLGSPRSKSTHYHRRHTVTEGLERGLSSPMADSDEGDTEMEGGHSRAHRRPTSPSALSSLTALTGLSTGTSGSGSSSGSGSTITQVSFNRRGYPEKEDSASLFVQQGTPAHPGALSFLDPDSPAVTEDSIKRSVAEAETWRAPDTVQPKTSPSARSASSSSSSASSSFHSDASSSKNTAETDRSTSPERSLNGDSSKLAPPTLSIDPAPPQNGAQFTERRRQGPAYRYGTPEMPRGTANLPHIPTNVLTPRVPNQGHVKHLPRAEKLPLSGYELLAARLSSSSRGHARRHSSFSSTTSGFTSRRDSVGSGSHQAGALGEEQPQPPRIKPIYRKFEALNHRLLLHLQDELSELEEQLHRLDTADTQNRRMQNRIQPASRRTDYMTGGELQWHRTDILGKIGYKLGHYNHVLSSFTSTRDLPSPSLADVNEYRAYLVHESPIAEIETRFLEPIEDLVTLAPTPTSPSDSSRSSSSTGSASASEPEDLLTRPEYYQALSDDSPTPLPDGRASSSYLPSPTPSRPRTANAAHNDGSRSSHRPPTRRGGKDGTAAPPEQPHPLRILHVAVAMALAVLVPILTFAVIPGFVGRMTVVLLVGVSLVGSLVQSGSLALGSTGKSGYGTAATTRDVVLCAGVYGGVMAAVAAVVG
ncbi:hypothetical protein NKR23_g5365 [Pleurostoma richardsiae]|uniref:DUF6594 domain-containing protein n=1 Tax=Pleurostoma richardsiae TaxID=41990 RepID=A0AA38RH98_9PEZI|nr:hypothetical protein NKR23_g5365 [Pleurostoma richardsiae]